MSEAIPSWARVGAKVVCIRDDWFTDPEPGFTHPDKGDILTIIEIDADGWGGRRVGLIFAEKAQLDVYAVEFFRPLVTLEDDITTYFAELLDVREPVEA